MLATDLSLSSTSSLVNTVFCLLPPLYRGDWGNPNIARMKLWKLLRTEGWFFTKSRSHVNDLVNKSIDLRRWMTSTSSESKVSKILFCSTKSLSFRLNTFFWDACLCYFLAEEIRSI